MRPLDPLHIGVMLFGLAAAIWSFYLINVIAFPIAILLGIIAAVVLLFARVQSATAQRVLRITTATILVLHLAFATVFVMATSVNIGQDPNRGINLDPPQWAVELIARIILPFALVLAVGLVVALAPLFKLPETILAGAGALLVLVAVVLAPFPESGDPPNAVQQLLFLTGFLGLAATLVVTPLVRTHPPWRRTRSRQTAATTSNV